MPLEKYKKKRKFKKRPEPGAKAPTTGRYRFVVPEHHSSRLHYDFRLEMRENTKSKFWVLKSWAVPKGIPKTVGIKHLAVMTEDHPVNYFSFAGEIPKGEYGAGKVYIWDTGKYVSVHNNLSPEQMLEKGEVDIILFGKKLKGRYVLVKTKWLASNRGRSGHGRKNNWLIFKVKK